MDPLPSFSLICEDVLGLIHHLILNLLVYVDVMKALIVEKHVNIVNNVSIIFGIFATLRRPEDHKKKKRKPFGQILQNVSNS